MKTEFFQIENRAGKLKLNDGVNKESADKLIEEMDRMYGQSAVAAQMQIGDVVCAADDALESVEVEINSPGGSVFEGTRIYNALRGMSARGIQVSTTVNGLAASMGSVILMAGDKRDMTPGSRIMIHEPSTMAYGDARAMKRNADLLEGIANDLAAIYAERSGYDKDKIRTMMLAETWMDADAAAEYGFVNSDRFDSAAENVNSPVMSFLASIFKTADKDQLEAAQAEVDRIAADYNAAVAERDAHAATIGEHIATIAAHLETITNLQSTLAERDASIESMNASITSRDERIEALTQEVEAAKASAGAQAITMLASVGQTQPLEETSGDEPQGILAKFEAIKDPSEKLKFYRQHEKELKPAVSNVAK